MQEKSCIPAQNWHIDQISAKFLGRITGTILLDKWVFAGKILFGPLSFAARLPSQALRASSPGGRAKCTPVGGGQVVVRQTKNSNGSFCCVVTVEGAVFMPSQSRSARQLPRTRGSQNVTFRPGLPRLRGRWPAGPERATNNAGASLTADPRRGTLSFVTQKFFCFGAINNRRNNWCVTPFCRHMKRVEHFGLTGFDTCQSLISIPVMVRPELL